MGTPIMSTVVAGASGVLPGVRLAIAVNAALVLAATTLAVTALRPRH
jgi:hypothetical protein